ncbi:Uncharacterised protein [Yersinia aldovae]|nr:Uncharacterised protein [Yersinia aldovae]
MFDATPRLAVEATVSVLFPARAYWPEKPLLLPVSAVLEPLTTAMVEPLTPLSALAMLPLSAFNTSREVAVSRLTVAAAEPRLLA